jgi:hypothetical protein|tara:strand:- start:1326 stop:1466 length:141 start_codon:yes stop_codon:yes gene_type:complete
LVNCPEQERKAKRIAGKIKTLAESDGWLIRQKNLRSEGYWEMILIS